MKTIEDYKLFKFIGKGSYGEIYLAKKENDSQLYAVKVLDRKRMDKPKLHKYLEREISICQELNHANIAKFYKKLVDDSNYYLIEEYCNGGTLTQCMEKYKAVYNEPFSIEIIQHFMKQIIDAICYIHSLGIIHRDIKLDNILLSFKNKNDIKNLNLMQSEIKIIDFGVATKLDNADYAFTVVGSPLTMDPLLLKKYIKSPDIDVFEGYTEKADIWSLGIIFYQLLTGHGIFKFNSIEEFIKKIEEGNYVLPINKNFSKEAVSFLNSMLQYDPDNRISVHDLSRHVFITNNVNTFTKIDLKQISNKINEDGLVINIKGDPEIIKALSSSEKNIWNQLIQNNIGNLIAKKRNDQKERLNIDKDCVYLNEHDSNNNTNNKINVLKQRNNEIKEKEKRNENIVNENEEMKIYIKGLLDEYEKAKDYFNKNGLVKQEKEANETINCIKSILKSYEQGEQINYESLPKPITPEYIYNTSASKRNAIFQEIIDKYKEKKNDLEISVKNEMRKYKNCDSFLLIKNNVMSKLNNDKNKIEKYKQQIKYIQDAFNNKWTPAPEFVKDLEMKEYEKTTYEGCEYKIIFHPTKNNYYNNSNLIIRLNMRINENKNYYGIIKICNYGDFEDDIIWRLKDNEWNNLSNYVVNVDFYLDKVFQGNQKINISKLKENQHLKISYPMPFLAQPENANINFDIKVILPEGKKIAVKEMKEIIIVKKIYPPFEGKSPYTNEISRDFIKKL